MPMLNPITTSIEERKKCFDLKNIQVSKIDFDSLTKDPSKILLLANELNTYAVENMKFYIFENWHNITIDEWNSISFSFNNKYFGKDNFVGKFRKIMKFKYQVITKIGFVYDEHDGDLSFFVNREKWQFLSNEQVHLFYLNIRKILEKRE